jgi:PAS domain S-box-containing protein
MTEPLPPYLVQPSAAPPNGQPAAQPLDLNHEQTQQAKLLEQKLAAEAAEAKYLAMTESSSSAIISADEEGRIVAWNASAENLFGHTASEAIGQPLTLIIPPRHRAGHTGGMARLKRGGAGHVLGQVVTLEGLHKDGHEMMVEMSLSRWQQAGQTFFTGILQDISARKKQEVQLREALDRSQELSHQLREALQLADELMRGMASSIAILTRERVVLSCNDRYAAWFGKESAQLIGCCITQLERPEDTKNRWPYYEEVMQGKTVTYLGPIKYAGGHQRWLKITNTPRFDALGQVIGYITSGEDVTELVLAREQAHSAERAKQQFLATISHELRTPLNGVLGGLQILQRMPLPAQASKILQASSESGKLLLSIINDVLDFSKIDSGKINLYPEPILLSDTLAAMQEMLNTLPRKPGVVLHFECDPALDQPVLVDDMRLRQIITNLTSNALKFTLRGWVRVAARQLSYKNERLQVQLQVQDSGIGMNREMLDKLFTPFSQADGSHTRQFGGTGLGLSIVKRLVEAMGGEVFVSSQVGTGSLFNVRLPLPLANSHNVEEARAVAITRRLMSGLARSETPSFSQAFNIAKSPTPAPEAPLTIQEKPATLAQQDQTLGSNTPANNFAPSAKSLSSEAAKEKGQDKPEERADDDSEKPLVGLRVLVADDAPINRLVASTFLEEFGAQVFEAEHGEQAVRKLRDEGLQVDLVLMDMQMPIMDGMEATRQIRRVDSLRKLKIVAMTGNITPEDRQACIDSGMNGYLSKPLTIPALLEAVTS